MRAPRDLRSGGRPAWRERRPAARRTPCRGARQRSGVDGADHRDLRVALREDRPAAAHEIVPGDRLDALDRARGRPAIGMAREAFGEEAARRHDARIVLLVAQARDGLGAHALDRVGSKRGSASARRSSSKASSACFTSVLSEPPTASLPALKESSMARAARRSWKASESYWPAPSSSRRASICATPGLSAGVLGRAALEGEGDGDQRHHVGVDVPGLDAAGRDRLHLGRRDARRRAPSGFARSSDRASAGAAHAPLLQVARHGAAGDEIALGGAGEVGLEHGLDLDRPAAHLLDGLADGERRAVDAGERGLAVGGVDRLGDEPGLGALDRVGIDASPGSSSGPRRPPPRAPRARRPRRHRVDREARVLHGGGHVPGACD